MNLSSHKVSAKLYVSSHWHYIEAFCFFIFEIMTYKQCHEVFLFIYLFFIERLNAVAI